VSVNGVKCHWELLDPHRQLVQDIDLACDGEAYDVHQRSAYIAAQDGELLIYLPINKNEENSEPLSVADTMTHTGNMIRDCAFNNVMTHPAMLIEVNIVSSG